MARADRAFGALVAITLTLAGWLSLALLFTLFPAMEPATTYLPSGVT